MDCMAHRMLVRLDGSPSVESVVGGVQPESADPRVTVLGLGLQPGPTDAASSTSGRTERAHMDGDIGMGDFGVRDIGAETGARPVCQPVGL